MLLYFNGLGSLLLTLLVVSVQSAPAMHPRMLSFEKWKSPCGENTQIVTGVPEGEMEYEALTDSELLNMVAVQATTALHHALRFRDDYIKQTFNTDFAVLHSEWKENYYEWLPGKERLGKELGKPVSSEYLNKLQLEALDDILLDTYEIMQLFAVGIEQIVWDQEDRRLEFLEQFKDTESTLQSVLCEIQAALIERGVTPRNNVTRSVMTNEYRIGMSSQATFRNLRDWLIFRDYMNALEYVAQVFEYLSAAVKS